MPLLVTHYHFLGWPDHGVPKFATSLVEFIRRVRHGYVSESPILVHCSAGAGRTGTYITLDAMLERMKELDNINVYEFVRNMRAKRVQMVQTLVGFISLVSSRLDSLHPIPLGSVHFHPQCPGGVDYMWRDLNSGLCLEGYPQNPPHGQPQNSWY